MSRLYIVTLLIQLICRVHHDKLWAGWSTSWNQDCWEKHHNLTYADDTTLLAENEELKSLLMKVKEESENAGLKLNIQKMKIMASGPISSVQFSSVAQSCPTLCDPMNHSTPGLPVHHQLPEFTQTHVHRVGDAIQPSHPLLSPSPPAPNPSQHQSLFQWVNSSHEVAKVLEFQL